MNNDDPQANRGPEIVLLMIILLAVTWTSVILRFYTRIWITKAFAADDWLIIAALGSYALFGGFVFASVHYGLGRHDKELAQSQVIKARMYYALSTVIYIPNMVFVKISIALLILRIVVARRYSYIIIASMILVVLWSLAEWLFVIFQCRPVQFQWDRAIEEGICIGNFTSAALAFSVMSIVSDWFYALLPIPVLWPLKISLQSKISVALILSLGIIASVSPFVRIKYLLNMKDYDDILYTNTDALIWTIIEPGIGITTASVATFRPLLVSWKVPGFRSSANASYRGTMDNQGPYINFENLVTLPLTTRSISRDTKPQPAAHGSSHGHNWDKPFTLSHGKIVKTVEISVVHNNSDRI